MEEREREVFSAINYRQVYNGVVGRRGRVFWFMRVDGGGRGCWDEIFVARVSLSGIWFEDIL